MPFSEPKVNVVSSLENIANIDSSHTWLINADSIWGLPIAKSHLDYYPHHWSGVQDPCLLLAALEFWGSDHHHQGSWVLGLGASGKNEFLRIFGDWFNYLHFETEHGHKGIKPLSYDIIDAFAYSRLITTRRYHGQFDSSVLFSLIPTKTWIVL
jgi:hypothetical protein